MENTTIEPATAPIKMEEPIPTVSAPAVMPTKPAKIPFNAMDKSGFLRKIQDTVIDAIAPEAAASVVVHITNDTA